ncbi:MAG TPA: hypothetical protein VGX76_03340, partial [Pirellulales bacterium]|nr:hypothetical protein [Pirellulales bacterium]
LVDESRREGGNPWGIRFLTMFHQTNDAELFKAPDELKEQGCHLDGKRWVKGKQSYVPLYEAKMVQAFDHRAASVEVVDANWVRQGQTIPTSLVSHQNPEFVVQPRWWVDEAEVDRVLAGARRPAYLCYKDVTSATNQRTMIAAMVPHVVRSEVRWRWRNVAYRSRHAPSCRSFVPKSAVSREKIMTRNDSNRQCLVYLGKSPVRRYGTRGKETPMSMLVGRALPAFFRRTRPQRRHDGACLLRDAILAS